MYFKIAPYILEETETYRIVFTIHQNGEIDYSVCYKNNPGVVYSGGYVEQSIHMRSISGFPEIVDELLHLEPKEVVDYAARPAVTGVHAGARFPA